VDGALHGKTEDPALATSTGFAQDLGSGRFLFGRRTANIGGQMKLTYDRSSRLSISVNGGGAYIKHIQDSNDIVGFFSPDVITKSFGANVEYALSPRTQIGVGGDVVTSGGTGVNNGPAADSTFGTTRQATVSVNRTMSRRWFVSGSIGGGTSKDSTGPHETIIYSAGLGFKTYSHTFMGGLDRSIGDPYSMALGFPWFHNSYTASWIWRRPESNWFAQANYDHLHAIHTGLPTTNTWHGTATVGRMISREFAVLAQCSFARVGARRYIYLGQQYQLEQTGFRVSLKWMPRSGHLF
jgi:hypothetical protein